MNFEGQYLTYSEYQALGGTLEETPFNLLEFECRKQIDVNTQCRLQNVDEIPNEVKICLFKMINNVVKYNEIIETTNKGVASENIDGYSVSYLNPSQVMEIIETHKAEINDLITTELFGVIVNKEHLIYVGVK